MALLADDWLPALLSSVAYIAALTFFTTNFSSKVKRASMYTRDQAGSWFDVVEVGGPT